jgi:hypothetical protein
MANEVVRIRIMGPPEAVDQLAADLETAGRVARQAGGDAGAWCDVRDVSAPYANRGNEGGVRRYLTALVPVREGSR